MAKQPKARTVLVRADPLAVLRERMTLHYRGRESGFANGAGQYCTACSRLIAVRGARYDGMGTFVFTYNKGSANGLCAECERKLMSSVQPVWI